MTIQAPETSFRRNTNLDALRGIAILMVLGCHSGMAIALLNAATAYTSYWTRIGWAGVDLFFVLSGFLIAGLLFKDFEESGKIGIARFYLRRGLKIWPSFYALIAAGLLVDAVTRGHLRFSIYHLLSELLFVQDYFRSIWGITWSLAVEEHFYLALPLLLIVVLRRNRVKPFAALPWVFAGIALFSLACRFPAGWSQDGVINPWTCIFPTHLRMDGLMFGVLICYFKRFRPGIFQWMVRWPGGWVLVAAALALLSIFPQESRQMHTWGFTVNYLAAGFLVAKAVAQEGPRPVRTASNLLARIGVYSYSIYLWHMFFVWKILPHFHLKSPLAGYWGSIIGPIVFGILASKAIEIPVLRFRDRAFPSLGRQSSTPVLKETAVQSAVSS